MGISYEPDYTIRWTWFISDLGCLLIESSLKGQQIELHRLHKMYITVDSIKYNAIMNTIYCSVFLFLAAYVICKKN